MRALVFDRKLEFRADYPDPVAAPDESIVRVSLAGICGTDLELARGYMNFRGVPGHERRVVGEINAGCGRCAVCAAGLGRHCPDRTVLGILGRDGAFADFLTLPDANLIPVPDSVPDEVAVFVEPIAAAYEILEQIHLARNRSIVVIGDGRLGGMVAIVLKSEKYLPLVAGHHPEKLRRLESLSIAAEAEPAFRAHSSWSSRAAPSS